MSETARTGVMLPAMRFLLLFWAGFLPALLVDALYDQHGQVRGAVPALCITLLLAALLAGLTRLTLVPLLRRSRALRERGLSADALAFASGLAWALSSLFLTRLSATVQQFFYRQAVLSALAWILLAAIFALVILRLRPALRAPRTSALAALLMIGLGAVAALASWGDAQRRAKRALSAVATAAASVQSRPDVIVVVLDTGRAELLGGDFEGHAPMPWLDSFAERGRRWERGYSAANSTPPGHAALFTGRYPADCEALSKGQIALQPGQFTVAEQLSALGWRCAATVSNARIGNDFGFQQGFELYDDDLVNNNSVRALAKRVGASSLAVAACGQLSKRVVTSAIKRFSQRSQDGVTAAETALRTAEVLDELDLQPDQPLFLFVNFIDPHLLYVTREDLAQEFGPNLRDDDFESVRRNSSQFHLRLDAMTERIAAGDEAKDLEQRLRWVREAYYEQCRELDEGLRMLFEDLQRRGRAGPEDLIFITSDHGEELGHHAEFLHGTTLFEASIRVPFLVSGPGITPGVEASAPGSNVDFFPTVLAAIGMQEEHWPRELAGHPLQRPLPTDRLVRFESGTLRGFMRGERKLIAYDHGDRLEWLFAFDLGADPEERNNLLGRNAPDWVREFAAAPPFEPSQAAREVVRGEAGAPDLAELGYADELDTRE